MSLLIRVRTQVGTWRLTDVKPTDTIEELKIRLETEHRTELLNKPITKDASGSIILPFGSTVASLGLVNGDMIYASVNESKTGVHESAKATSRFIKDGNIVAKEYAVGSHNGFRPGMMALKSMKMQWTLNDFIALDEQFVYKPKQAEKAFCTQVSIDESSIEGNSIKKNRK
jgi:nuclear protein localization family protein 4